jgi:general secretion pathway protein G
LRVPLAIYRIDIGRYPTTEEGLDALIHCPKGLEAKWKGPYLQDPRLLLDFWGRPHRYLCPGVRNPKGYDLSSMGPDGVPSGDDIGNWMK